MQGTMQGNYPSLPHSQCLSSAVPIGADVADGGADCPAGTVNLEQEVAEDVFAAGHSPRGREWQDGQVPLVSVPIGAAGHSAPCSDVDAPAEDGIESAATVEGPHVCFRSGKFIPGWSLPEAFPVLPWP